MANALITDPEIAFLCDLLEGPHAVLCDLLEGPHANLNAHKRSVLDRFLRRDSSSLPSQKNSTAKSQLTDKAQQRLPGVCSSWAIF
jgi:hypothetical protein